MEIKTIYIEFDINNENYKEYEQILEEFLNNLNNSKCLSQINKEISVQEIDQSEMVINLDK